jgi:glycosyltransferase involved in cell wall biosynthesis
LLTLDLKGVKIVTHWHADILGQKNFYPYYKFLKKKSQKIIQNNCYSEMYKLHSLPLKPFLNKTYILPNTINEHKLHLFEGEKNRNRFYKTEIQQ